MLYQMIDKLCEQINKIDAVAELPQFAAQVRKMRPNLNNELLSQGILEKELNKSIMTMSFAQLVLIKNIPSIADELTKILKVQNINAAYRCSVAACLAYLVNPKDLLPDNLPGGYGFIDDFLLLQEACALSWEISGDMKKAEERRKIFQFTFMFVPESRREEFQTAINSLTTTFNIMRALDPILAEMTIQMLIQNPLQEISQQSHSFGSLSPFKSQFSEFSKNYRPQYSWQNGNTMGINFPGGGGVAADSSGVYIL